MDFTAPSIYAFFSINAYLNDFIYNRVDVDECLTEVSKNLYVIPASPHPKDIKRELKKSDKEEMKTLERMMTLMEFLRKFDYILLDTHPGLSYSSINSLILSDVIFLILRPDKIDVEGTKTLLRLINSLYKPVYGVINRDNGKDVKVGIKIVTRIPCSCDVVMDYPFFVKDFKDHSVTESLKELVDFIISLL